MTTKNRSIKRRIRPAREYSSHEQTIMALGMLGWEKYLERGRGIVHFTREDENNIQATYLTLHELKRLEPPLPHDQIVALKNYDPETTVQHMMWFENKWNINSINLIEEIGASCKEVTEGVHRALSLHICE